MLRIVYYILRVLRDAYYMLRCAVYILRAQCVPAQVIYCVLYYAAQVVSRAGSIHQQEYLSASLEESSRSSR